MAAATSPVGDLPAALRTQAGHCARLGSPLYAELLERAAIDVETGGPAARILRGHEGDSPDSMLALRLMGAVHRRVLEGASSDLASRYTADADGAWAAFRRVLAEDAEAIRTLLNRPVQTNEVGRCAALLPGFFAVAGRAGLPLRLLEVGASAGLNLRWDRYRYAAGGFSWGNVDSPVRIEFELSGEVLSAAPVEVVERRGCDSRPVDPCDEEGKLTLESFVWPDQVARMGRLRTALEAAEEMPIAVERAPAASWIADRLGESRDGVATVVFHSIVTQYMPASERLEFEQLVRDAGAAADQGAPLAWLRMEPAGERAEVRLTCWPGGEDRLIARAGYHGSSVEALA